MPKKSRRKRLTPEGRATIQHTLASLCWTFFNRVLMPKVLRGEFDANTADAYDLAVARLKKTAELLSN